MGIIWTILIGFVVGLLARFLKPGRDKMGIIWTTLVGIAGAVIAKYIGQAVGWYGPEEPAGFIASILGAILLLFVFQMIKSKS